MDHVPRSKLGGDLGAKIEHLELKKKMRVDEIRVLDREKRRCFDETKCSLEKEENEPKRKRFLIQNLLFQNFPVGLMQCKMDAMREEEVRVGLRTD